MDAASYFFLNSFLLDLVLAVVFLLLGLLLGWLLWGRCRCSHKVEQPASNQAVTPEAPAAWSGLMADVEQGKARIDQGLGLVYAQKPEQVDDLEAIKGVAEVLGAKLNAFGVYTFRQIAGWDDAIIQEFSKRLAFKDRVKREDWVGQARQLHKEKYGEEI